jgi:ABC-type transport system involved in multi-copper enzyme maturation permease subunit
MSLHGVRTIALLELRQRLRTSRWQLALGTWFLIIGAAAALTWWAVHDQPSERGTTLYDVVLFFVLGLGMLLAPSLTSTSINGDRDRGVLATMQTTLLTPADIVLGKLVAAWTISLTFLVAASPFLVWVWIAGGVEFGRMLLAAAVLAFVLAVICALGLMFSTFTVRTLASAVLTYLTVASLIFGTVIAFLLAIPLTWGAHETVRVKVVPASWYEQHPQSSPDDSTTIQPTAADCTFVTQARTVRHTERIWWLLALNPFVVVADAAPSARQVDYLGFIPLQMISDAARTARMGGTSDVLNECWPELQPTGVYLTAQQLQNERLSKVHAVWPYGFVFLGVIGAASTLIAVRRLRTPARNLPAATRFV